MFKKLQYTANLTIPNGAASGSVRFTPPAGFIIACAIFNSAIANTGFVTAKISTDGGDVICDAVDIRDYRDREAGYIEGKKPLYLKAEGGTYVLDVMATENFTAACNIQLQLVYERPENPLNC